MIWKMCTGQELMFVRVLVSGLSNSVIILVCCRLRCYLANLSVCYSFCMFGCLPYRYSYSLVDILSATG